MRCTARHRFVCLGAQLASERSIETSRPKAAHQGATMRSIEFFTYLLPSAKGDGTYLPSRCKLTSWQAIAYPGAMPVEGSREVRRCPESADERKELGFGAGEDIH
jgi:hypothetical protein